jgi:hypothetical protein
MRKARFATNRAHFATGHPDGSRPTASVGSRATSCINAGLHAGLGSWTQFLDDVGLELSVVVRRRDESPPTGVGASDRTGPAAADRIRPT